MILPVVRRELRVQARSRAALFFRFGAAGLGAAAVFVFMVSLMGSGAPSSAGRSLYQALSWVAFLFCLAEGPRVASSCLSEEKRQGTLGLLFLTDLRTYDIVLGKLAATSLNSFYGLIGVFPALALPLLIGGVTGAEFWRLALALVSTLFLSFAAGLCASAVSSQPLGSLAGSSALVAGLTLLPPLAQTAFKSRALCFSPWDCFRGSTDLTYGATPTYYWAALGQLWVLAVLLLLASCLLLKRFWNVAPAETRVEEWRRLASWVGPPAWYLEKNPVQWLVARHRRSAVWCRALACLVALAAVAFIEFAPPSTRAGGWLLVFMAGLHIGLCLWIAVLASQLLWQERDSGALEILLCSPISTGRIVDGFVEGLRWIFAVPLTLILGAELVLCVCFFSLILNVVPLGLMTLTIAVGVGTFISDYHALAWYGLWSGLSTRKQGAAISKTILWVFVIPLLFSGWCAALWVGGAIIKNLVFATFARTRLEEQLRRRSAEPFATAGSGQPRSDPGHLPPVLHT